MADQNQHVATIPLAPLDGKSEAATDIGVRVIYRKGQGYALYVEPETAYVSGGIQMRSVAMFSGKAEFLEAAARFNARTQARLLAQAQAQIAARSGQAWALVMRLLKDIGRTLAN